MLPQNEDRYRYTPLPDGQYVRILTLYPGHQADPLSGELQVIHIDETGEYEPLSYVWGDPARCSKFICAHKTIELTASLRGALQRVRKQDQPRRLWVDQLCINQDDQAERSKQIRFMNTIYKNATHVLVWLGDDPLDKTRNAFELIRSLDQTFKDKAKKEKFRVRYTEKLNEQSAGDWAPLEHLTSKDWFSRGWIVQEIGTRAPATMYWGKSECDWAIINGVVQELADFHHLRGHFDLKTLLIKYVWQRFIEPPKLSRHANRFSLMYELQRARHCKLTDPRDRVFIFLGHYSLRMGNTLLAEMQADYSRTVEEVYIDVATRALFGDPEKNLITLACVQHSALPLSTEETLKNGLPSWAPDWRHSEGHLMSEPGGLLSVRGIKVDVIEVCSKTLRWKEFYYDPTREDLAIKSLWTDVCRKTGFDLHTRYMDDADNDSAVFAYLQTLSVGGIATALRDGRRYQDIDQKSLFARGLAYLTKALGTSSLVSPELRQMAEGGDYYNWIRDADCAASNRAFACTQHGRYVLGPRLMQPGDILCVLYGGKMPFVLRPWSNGEFLLVGESYTHGLMDGQAVSMMETGELVEEMFHVR